MLKVPGRAEQWVAGQAFLSAAKKVVWTVEPKVYFLVAVMVAMMASQKELL